MKRVFCAALVLMALAACGGAPEPPKPRYVVKHYVQGLGEYYNIYEADEVHQDGNCVRLYNAGDGRNSPKAILCGKVAVERR